MNNLNESEKRIFNELYKRPSPMAYKSFSQYRIDDNPNGENLEIDLLYLPEDTKTSHKYAMVGVDIGSRFWWAIPMTRRDSEASLVALKELISQFNKHSGKSVKHISTDKGSEFTNKLVKEYIAKQNIVHRLVPTGNHLNLVENANLWIGKEILKEQSILEFISGKTEKDWSDNITKILKTFNNRVNKSIGIKPIEAIKGGEMKPKSRTMTKVSNENKGKYHPTGTFVRRVLEKNEVLDITDTGIRVERRRASDPSWSWIIYKVGTVYKPENSLVWRHMITEVEHYKGKEPVTIPKSFTYWQLQEVSPDL